MTEIKKSPFNILFVDDEEKTRKYFVKGLEKEFNILTAESVDEAKKIIEEKHNEIAVVITDQRMPGGNGVKLLQHLREEYPQIIRLLTTAYSDLTDAIECVNKGEILRYIQKPWDYDMLKHELGQAIDLFEIKKERNELLHEKMMVKRRMTKIDRAQQLILLAKTMNYIRFADLAMQDFIGRFATIKNNNEEQNWQDFELGNNDLLETLFLLEVVEKVNNKIPFNQNYQFENTINSKQILAIVEELAKLDNIALNNNSVVEIGEVAINEYGFKIATEELLKHIAKISNEFSFKIANLDNAAANNQIALEFVIAKGDKTDNDNIFFAPPIQKDKVESYTSLLVCYLLIHHHGGTMEVRNEGDKIEYSIYLPKNPLSMIDDKKISAEDLDDMLLAVIMGDI